MVFNLDLNVPPVNYFQYLEKIYNHTQTRRKNNQKCNNINAKYIRHGNFGWKDPMGLAAGVYLYPVTD